MRSLTAHRFSILILTVVFLAVLFALVRYGSPSEITHTLEDLAILAAGYVYVATQDKVEHKPGESQVSALRAEILELRQDVKLLGIVIASKGDHSAQQGS